MLGLGFAFVSLLQQRLPTVLSKSSFGFDFSSFLAPRITLHDLGDQVCTTEQGVNEHLSPCGQSPAVLVLVRRCCVSPILSYGAAEGAADLGGEGEQPKRNASQECCTTSRYVLRVSTGLPFFIVSSAHTHCRKCVEV